MRTGSLPSTVVGLYAVKLPCHGLLRLIQRSLIPLRRRLGLGLVPAVRALVVGLLALILMLVPSSSAISRASSMMEVLTRFAIAVSSPIALIVVSVLFIFVVPIVIPVVVRILVLLVA